MTDGEHFVFIALWVLSKICVYGFLVLGVGVTVGAATFVQRELHSFPITLAFAVWFFVTTMMAKGYVQFYWNETLGKIIDMEKR